MKTFKLFLKNIGMLAVVIGVVMISCVKSSDVTEEPQMGVRTYYPDGSGTNYLARSGYLDMWGNLDMNLNQVTNIDTIKANQMVVQGLYDPTDGVTLVYDVDGRRLTNIVNVAFSDGTVQTTASGGASTNTLARVNLDSVSLLNATYTVLTFGSIRTDHGSNVDLAADVYNCPEAGDYFVVFEGYISTGLTASDSYQFTLQALRDGISVATAKTYRPRQWASLHHGALITGCTTDSYFQIRAYQNNGATETFGGGEMAIWRVH